MLGKGKLRSVSTTFGYLLAFLMISVIIFCYSSFSARPEASDSGLVRLIAFIDTITTTLALLGLGAEIIYHG